MTLHSLVLAAYGLENVRPYRIGAGRNNEHWYVGAGLVLRRYGPFRSDAAIDYEHDIVGQLRERGWPVAVPIPSDAGRTGWSLMMVAAIPCSRGWRAAAAAQRGRGSPGSEMVGFWVVAAPRPRRCLGSGATGCLSADS